MTRGKVAAQGREFVKHVLPAVLKPARTLWHEVIGFLFLVLALWAVPSAIRGVRQFDGDAGSFVRLLLIGIFILFMAGFGISSFRRARKISRS